ncbi:MAG: SPOR domain-containing protein [Stenotrophomonas sp.]
MLSRFLIVVLAILNIGVALWWLAPRTPALPPPEPAETGVATLELILPEALPATAAAVQTAPAVATDLPAAAPAATSERCLSLGPFADRAQVQAAVATLGADLLRSHLREVPPKAASSYRVILPPAATREEAQATARRIADAGFSDHFVMGQGEEANAIALGQYRNREGAERRQAALAAAGFPAQLLASGGEEASSWWLDAAHAGTTSAAALQRRSGAQRQQMLDCARLR